MARVLKSSGSGTPGRWMIESGTAVALQLVDVGIEPDVFREVHKFCIVEIISQ